MTESPVPFAVHIEETVIDDLRRRVAATRWPDEIRGQGWDLGADLASVRELARYWCDGFDWRAQETALNAQLPGYRCRVDGLDVHFARVCAPTAGPAPVPIMLLHGWPSSFVEMRQVALALAADGAFDVIVPSLPGHGFSSVPSRTGFGADECAAVFIRLMTEMLGHRRFVVHGGDRGAFVATSMGVLGAEAVAGLHLTLPGGIPGSGDERTAEEHAWLANAAAWLAEEGGYSAIQSTRPQTLAYAMHDSPVGMLAWIVEKFRAWSDCGGDLSACFTADQLLTNATIYWATGTSRSSAHWYWEHRVRPPAILRPVRVEVPTGVAAYPKEVVRPPRSAVARKYDLVQWTDMPRGGHFAAYEDPIGLTADIRKFVRAHWQHPPHDGS